MIRALIPILYRGRDYRIGEALPEDDPEMVDAWIEAGSAADDVEALKIIVGNAAKSGAYTKAKRASARSGRTGKVDAGQADVFGDDLTGIVPRR